ncbi:MAG: hypothetical protein JXR83_20000 [Deltaproteobacteria bacterium]|nr:hypothetical protein [Deltaproteobacteria bacterium]
MADQYEDLIAAVRALATEPDGPRRAFERLRPTLEKVASSGDSLEHGRALSVIETAMELGTPQAMAFIADWPCRTIGQAEDFIERARRVLGDSRAAPLVVARLVAITRSQIETGRSKGRSDLNTVDRLCAKLLGVLDELDAALLAGHCAEIWAGLASCEGGLVREAVALLFARFGDSQLPLLERASISESDAERFTVIRALQSMAGNVRAAGLLDAMQARERNPTNRKLFKRSTVPKIETPPSYAVDRFARELARAAVGILRENTKPGEAVDEIGYTISNLSFRAEGLFVRGSGRLRGWEIRNPKTTIPATAESGSCDKLLKAFFASRGLAFTPQHPSCPSWKRVDEDGIMPALFQRELIRALREGFAALCFEGAEKQRSLLRPPRGRPRVTNRTVGE